MKITHYFKRSLRKKSRHIANCVAKHTRTTRSENCHVYYESLNKKFDYDLDYGKTMNIDIKKILDVGEQVDPNVWNTSDVLAKLFEEGGEFARAIQVKVGKIKREQPSDEDFLEMADIMNTAIDALARANGLYDITDEKEKSSKREDFIRRLNDAIQKKCKKWERCIVRK